MMLLPTKLATYRYAELSAVELAVAFEDAHQSAMRQVSVVAVAVFSRHTDADTRYMYNIRHTTDRHISSVAAMSFVPGRMNTIVPNMKYNIFWHIVSFVLQQSVVIRVLRLRMHCVDVRVMHCSGAVVVFDTYRRTNPLRDATIYIDDTRRHCLVSRAPVQHDVRLWMQCRLQRNDAMHSPIEQLRLQLMHSESAIWRRHVRVNARRRLASEGRRMLRVLWDVRIRLCSLSLMSEQ